MDISRTVIDLIAEQALLEPSDVTLGSTLESLGIDSMGLVESIFSIEEAFDITIPFDANNPENGEFDLTSVATIVASIEHLIIAQKPVSSAT